LGKCRLLILGGFVLKADSGATLVLPNRKDRLLLAYLALQAGRPQTRERLSSLLWADRGEAQARDSLRQALASLRQTFRAQDLDPIVANRDSITLDPGLLDIDATAFEKSCAAQDTIDEAADLYQGPLLDGAEGSATEFENWLLAERERLEAMAIRLLTSASKVEFSEGEGDAVAALGHRLVNQDRLNEQVCRAAMRITFARGERSSALKLFGACREALEKDLGIGPERETEDLYRDVLTGRLDAPRMAAPAIDTSATIAVLPFVNLTGNERFDLFGEGLAEEITTGLGRFRVLFVIDRFSAAAIAQTTQDVAQIGQRLGASLLAQGSIQATASGLRITVRLIRAATRAQVWSEVFECELNDTPGLPARIASAIVATLQNRVEHAIVESTRGKPSMEAFECLLSGIKHLRGYAADDNAKALAMFREAVRLNPDYPPARAYLAFGEYVANDYAFAPLDEQISCRSRLQDAAADAPDDGRICWMLGSVQGYLGDLDDQSRQYQRALALNPNDANAAASYGVSLAIKGRGQEGIALIREGMRLNPYHPEWYWIDLGTAFFATRRYDDAIEAYKRRTKPKAMVLSRMAACYAFLGLDQDAREAARRVLEQNPEFKVSQLRISGATADHSAHWRAGMLKAGLPN
jgi:DNA-binding SARP family transcriptional activator/cytochrome c-type biogenesis protein CcmH/NrfG